MRAMGMLAALLVLGLSAYPSPSMADTVAEVAAVNAALAEKAAAELAPRQTDAQAAATLQAAGAKRAAPPRTAQEQLAQAASEQLAAAKAAAAAAPSQAVLDDKAAAGAADAKAAADLVVQVAAKIEAEQKVRRGRPSHFHAPLYIAAVILRAKQAGGA
jgi:hypothetical protein